MQPNQKLDFLNKFFDFTNPIPLQTPFTEEDLKNNDMKITLEIATRSNLRMQSDPKTSLVSFSCKNFGKHCYEIFAFRKDRQYFVETNYCKVHHRRNCELRNEAFEYLKIYNLMKLKKNLIQGIMVKLNLFQCSPSQILAKISNAQEYFFEKNINYNPEMRRKLRKRFDNIINIDIKKITKGGREEVYRQAEREGQIEQVKKENVKFEIKVKDEEPQESEFDETLFFQEKKKVSKKKKQKISKNKEKNKKKPKPKNVPHSIANKQNLYQLPPSQSTIKRPKLQQEIYYNPASTNELKQIKQLNQQFNGFEDIFAWSLEEPEQQIETETINDKLREGVLWSLRNSLVRKMEGQSLEDMRFLEDVRFGCQEESEKEEMG